MSAERVPEKSRLWKPLQTTLLSKLNRERLSVVLGDGRNQSRWKSFLFEKWTLAIFSVLGIDPRQTNFFRTWLWSKLTPTMSEDCAVTSHSIAQNRIIRNYGQYDLQQWLISNEDFFTLRILGLTHDIWEIPEGDTVWEKKVGSNPNEGKEIASWKALLTQILDWASQQEVDYVLSTYDIAFDKNHRLYPIFQAYERLSYLNGALNALKSLNSDKPIARWEKLIFDVLRYQIKAIRQNMTPATVAFFLRYWQEMVLLFDVANAYADQLKVSGGHYKEIEQYAEAWFLWNNVILPFAIDQYSRGKTTRKVG